MLALCLHVLDKSPEYKVSAIRDIGGATHNKVIGGSDAIGVTVRTANRRRPEREAHASKRRLICTANHKPQDKHRATSLEAGTNPQVLHGCLTQAWHAVQVRQQLQEPKASDGMLAVICVNSSQS